MIEMVVLACLIAIIQAISLPKMVIAKNFISNLVARDLIGNAVCQHILSVESNPIQSKVPSNHSKLTR